MKSENVQPKCLVYLRSSRTGDDANNDWCAQYQLALHYTKKANMELVDRIHIQGSSRSRTSVAAIEAVFKRKLQINDFDTLLATTWDRLTRDCRTGMALKDAAKALGITIVTTDEHIVADNISARQVRRIYRKYLRGQTIKEIYLNGQKKESHD